MTRRKKAPKEGVTIHAGDTVTIPAGQIQLSLKREQSMGTFSRQGIAWFMQMVYFQGGSETSAGLGALLEEYLGSASSVLEGSALLKDINLDSEAGALAAIERLKGRDDTVEAWAMRIIGAVGRVRSALAENDALTASWAMNYLTNCRAMLLYKKELEDLVWYGYQAEKTPDANGDSTQR
ncbi:MAG TPA: hypothetical protein VFQ25_00195 [Ktedonobacterales bacterium]|nr:hypothetical protein [Ktedonobacterales bacterium]